MPKSDRKKLLLKQEAFCQAYTDINQPTFGNAKQSYILTHPKSKEKQKVAEACSSRMLTKDKIINRISELFDSKGITDSKLIDKHNQLLNSTKFIQLGKETKEVPDNNTQASMLSLAYKIKGHLTESNNTNIDKAVIINLDSQQQARLNETIKELSQLNERLGLAKGKSGEGGGE